jgi:hypothetical protein
MGKSIDGVSPWCHYWLLRVNVGITLNQASDLAKVRCCFHLAGDFLA